MIPMGEWRKREYARQLSILMNEFELTNDEREFVKYWFKRIRNYGVKRLHPHLKIDELMILLVYLAFRHSGRRFMIQKHKGRFWFNPANKALVSLSKLLSFLFKERPL
jgi:hypothetical protein